MYTRLFRLVWKQYRRRTNLNSNTEESKQEMILLSFSRSRENSQIIKKKYEAYNAKINLLHLSLIIQTC